MIDPNAKVDAKYLMTRIETQAGIIHQGLVITDTKDLVVLVIDGKTKKEFKPAEIAERKTLKQSSMPEGQAGTMSPAEFLDLIEYLAGLK